MKSFPLFTGLADAMREAYKDVGIPVEVQVWDPFERKLKTETIWVDGKPLPTSWIPASWR